MKFSTQQKIRLWLAQVALWCQPRLEKLKLWWRPQQEKIQAWASPQLEQLKIRWQSLASREQTVILSGAAILGVLLLYAFIWSPLRAHLDHLRTQIQGEKNTAAWIQAAGKQIRSLESKESSNSNKALSKHLNLIQEEIRHSPLSKNLTQLTQNNANEIHCVFDQVDFDTLVAWLLEFSQRYELIVKQASVRRLNNVGLVQADFIFKMTP